MVVRFLSTETRHLELLLSAIETGSQSDNREAGEPAIVVEEWSWEERYITLLWLSQLLLAPFDLATISSAGTANAVNADVPGFHWPPDSPGVTLRVIPLAIRYLSSSGKERDAAKILLVRVAMRKDMQELGILHSLIKWALSGLRPTPNAEQPIYHYIGILSFLAGVLVSSASTADLDAHLSQIFQTVQDISVSEDDTFGNIRASAVARKTVIKVLRTVAILVLRNPTSMSSSEIVESAIGHMLESLADTATPVRLAASKALSMITLKLAPDMAAQVVEAVLESLNQNVLWHAPDSSGTRHRDLSGVNSLEWHGLILTLSHLLYRRSPPATNLSAILSALLTGLSFEQRSTSGSSVGTNVRDAACFGIWALARRYTTDELQAISLASLSLIPGESVSSTLQVLATQLVVCASLDSAGNIRRGSSAALQELIGRHPDTIAEGISIVQVVDYHAVALRSRAVGEVAYKAAQLSECYRAGLLHGLLDWRGIGDADSSARKNAAAGLGALVTSKRSTESRDHPPWTYLTAIVDRIASQVQGLKTRQVDERHGLLLCISSVLTSLAPSFRRDVISKELQYPTGLEDFVSKVKSITMNVLIEAGKSNYRRPELMVEAVSRLIIATFPILGLDMVFRESHSSKEGQLFTHILSTFQSNNPLQIIKCVDEAREALLPPDKEFLKDAQSLLKDWLHRSETESIESASEAASILLLWLDEMEREKAIQQWISIIREDQGGRVGQDKGFLYVIWDGLLVAGPLEDEIFQGLHKRWNSGHDIETRSTILQRLAKSSVLDTHAAIFAHMIADGLDDYTTNARGDVGSLVRIEAVGAAGRIWRNGPPKAEDTAGLGIFHSLFGKVLRLAAEKLDKIRAEAQQVVLLVTSQRYVKPLGSLLFLTESSHVASIFRKSTTSSYEYFRALLDMGINEDALTSGSYQVAWQKDLLEGYVSSADTGSEDLVRASRAALADFCEAGNANITCATLFEVAKRNSTNDRVFVPTLEVMSFLFDVRIIQKSALK